MVVSGSLPTLEIEFFVMIVNSIGKSPILDVSGVFGYMIVSICVWLQCRWTSLVTGNF